MYKTITQRRVQEKLTGSKTYRVRLRNFTDSAWNVSEPDNPIIGPADVSYDQVEDGRVHMCVNWPDLGRKHEGDSSQGLVSTQAMRATTGIQHRPNVVALISLAVLIAFGPSVCAALIVWAIVRQPFAPVLTFVVLTAVTSIVAAVARSLIRRRTSQR
jgi:hypothetical protein